MANNIHELAQEAFDSGNYQLALELFGHILHFSDKYAASVKSLISIDTYIGYGDSLARCGHIRESFSVFAFICSKLGYSVPMHKLKHLTIGLLESVTSSTVSPEARQRQLSVETQLPQKHLLHKQYQQQQQQQQQPLPLAPLTQSDSSECAKFVLHECSQQRTKYISPHAGNKNHIDIGKQFENETNMNRTQFVCNDHGAAQEYEKCDCKKSHPMCSDQMVNIVKMDIGGKEAKRRNNSCSGIVSAGGGGGGGIVLTNGVTGEMNNGNCYSNSECSVFLDNRCNSKTISNAHETDPLLCPMCAHVLLYPVTMNCGHTFCRDCVHNETQCQVCDKRFLVYGDALKQDVLITRLVEKWWMPHIQTESVNETTQTLLRQNALDEALKSCNDALEKCK